MRHPQRSTVTAFTRAGQVAARLVFLGKRASASMWNMTIPLPPRGTQTRLLTASGHTMRDARNKDQRPG